MTPEQEHIGRGLVRGQAIHRALRASHARASPEATEVINHALERIAARLIERSAELARLERRRTVLRRHAQGAFSEFMWPRQGMGRAASAVRQALEDLEALARNAPSELALPTATPDDDQEF